MTTAPPPRRRGAFVDLTPLTSSPAFARLWSARAAAGIGSQLTLVAVGLNVFDLVRPTDGVAAATFAVSLTGVLALVPTVLAGLYGGMLADAFDRRTVAVVAAFASWICTVVLAALSWTGAETVASLYVLTVLSATATTVLQASESAATPRLLPARLLPAAGALMGITVGISVTVGPGLAGVLVASVGFEWCYTIDAVLFVGTLIALATLPRMPQEGPIDRPGLASLLGGLAFLKSAPNIRTTFVVDIIAMTFGQPRVLYPAVGAVLLGGGALTVGLLSAAFAIGALLSSLFSGRLGGIRRQGLAIERAIIVYGVCIGLFGAVLAAAALGEAVGALPTPAGPLWVGIAAVLLAGAGGADNVSAIFRGTMLQTAAPDSMRGRLQGIFIVVVTGGPRVGDLYAGLLAATGLLFLPPVVGGVLIVILVALAVRRRGFLRYDSAHPTP
ncbi:MFS transporter [Amnibacterium kyonggiense]|uniref:Transmembrane secretion effector n=1 Tax=Amnibacterium kyonggiense TaxID=595671 RepID=A0A4R7FJ58_9MICO|nr:MFS transporter [Amnibacterium kyonggiense]TDS75696.1 transmembrane secretion effector [Amnibacterium kyonggiense]